MTITDRIATLYWDHVMTTGAKPTTLRLSRADKGELDSWVHRYPRERAEAYWGRESFMGMRLERAAPNGATEVA